MAAPKGHPRYGGRQKGTPNKSTQSLLKICEEEVIEPFRAMIRAAAKIIHPKEQVDAYEKICQYLHPKRKAIEVSGSFDPAILEEAERLSQLTEEELRKLAKEELKSR